MCVLISDQIWWGSWGCRDMSPLVAIAVFFSPPLTTGMCLIQCERFSNCQAAVFIWFVYVIMSGDSEFPNSFESLLSNWKMLAIYCVATYILILLAAQHRGLYYCQCGSTCQWMVIQSETIMANKNVNVNFDINHKTSVSFYVDNYNTNNIN